MALPDLDSRSVLDVVEENFQKLGLKAYAVRVIYIGEHTLTKPEIIQHFEKSVKGVNSGYCEINVNGFLLVYDSYFVHILEGSEDTVHRQLRFLFKREEKWIQKMQEKEKQPSLEVIMDENKTEKEWKMFARLKMLMVYHSISTLMFENWRAVTACPPSLVGKLDVHAPLAQHMEQLRICLANKVIKLCALAKADPNCPSNLNTIVFAHYCLEAEYLTLRWYPPRRSLAEETYDLLYFEGLPPTDPKIEALPEVALLDFLLQSPHVMDLRQVVYMHRRVDDYYFYFEHVWPLPNHFTPRYLYKLKVDDSFVEPLPVMPWELTKKEEKEGEEQEERQSVSSDSD